MPDGGGHSTLGRRAGRATPGGMGFGEASVAAAAINASINCWKAPCPTQMRKRSQVFRQGPNSFGRSRQGAAGAGAPHHRAEVP